MEGVDEIYHFGRFVKTKIFATQYGIEFDWEEVLKGVRRGRTRFCFDGDSKEFFEENGP